MSHYSYWIIQSNYLITISWDFKGLNGDQQTYCEGQGRLPFKLFFYLFHVYKPKLVGKLYRDYKMLFHSLIKFTMIHYSHYNIDISHYNFLLQ